MIGAFRVVSGYTESVRIGFHHGSSGIKSYVRTVINHVTITYLKNVRLTRIFHQKETFMAKAFRGEAVGRLPRASNNAGHGSLLLARRVKLFQFFRPLWMLHIVRWHNAPDSQISEWYVSFILSSEKISWNVWAKNSGVAFWLVINSARLITDQDLSPFI